MGAGVVLALACGGLGEFEPEPIDEVAIDVASLEGCTVGEAMTFDECALSALERAEPCGTFDIGCATIAMAFAVHCGDAAPVGDPTCSALPTTTTGRAAWATSRCDQAGLGTSGACAQTMVALQTGACPLEETESLCRPLL